MKVSPFGKYCFHGIRFKNLHYDLRIQQPDGRLRFEVSFLIPNGLPIQYSHPSSKRVDSSCLSFSIHPPSIKAIKLKRSIANKGVLHPKDFLYIDRPIISILPNGNFSIIEPLDEGEYCVCEITEKDLTFKLKGRFGGHYKLEYLGNFIFDRAKFLFFQTDIWKTSKREKPEFAWVFVYPHGTMIGIHYFKNIKKLKPEDFPPYYREQYEKLKKERRFIAKSHALKAKKYTELLDQKAYIAEGDLILGEISLLPDEIIKTRDDFIKHQREHAVEISEALDWWGRSTDLILHPIQIFNIYEKPKKFIRPKGPQTVIKDIKWA